MITVFLEKLPYIISSISILVSLYIAFFRKRKKEYDYNGTQNALQGSIYRIDHETRVNNRSVLRKYTSRMVTELSTIFTKLRYCEASAIISRSVEPIIESIEINHLSRKFSADSTGWQESLLSEIKSSVKNLLFQAKDDEIPMQLNDKFDEFMMLYLNKLRNLFSENVLNSCNSKIDLYEKNTRSASGSDLEKLKELIQRNKEYCRKIKLCQN